MGSVTIKETRARYVNGVWTRPRYLPVNAKIENGARLADLLVKAMKGEPVETARIEKEQG